VRLARALAIAEQLDDGLVDVITAQTEALRNERQQLETELAAARPEAAQMETVAPMPATVTASDLARLPPGLTRRLYKALRLAVLYDHVTNQTTCRITLVDTAAPAAR
jgi:hypothetical protein